MSIQPLFRGKPIEAMYPIRLKSGVVVTLQPRLAHVAVYPFLFEYMGTSRRADLADGELMASANPGEHFRRFLDYFSGLLIEEAEMKAENAVCKGEFFDGEVSDDGGPGEE